jgi:DNA-binding XRE family transcriptional regulator
MSKKPPRINRRGKGWTMERPIPAKAIRKWRRNMGLSQRDAAKALGMSRTALIGYEREGAPLYVALACSALFSDLEPYT